MDVSLRENPDERRFELLVDGAMAGLAAYKVRDGRTVITHSEIDPSFRGKGLGSELARRTLDHLKAQNARVVAVCPFFVKYVNAHHDWDDILEDL